MLGFDAYAVFDSGSNALLAAEVPLMDEGEI